MLFFSLSQTTFVVDEVSNIVKEAVEGTIGGSAYQQNKVNQWTSNVVEQCLNQLTKLGKPFKYIGEFLCMDLISLQQYPVVWRAVIALLFVIYIYMNDQKTAHSLCTDS